MLQTKRIETYLMKTNRLFLFSFGLIIFMLSGISFFIFLGKKFQNPLVIIVGVLLFFVVPLVIVNQKMNIFSKRATILLSIEFMEVQISDTLKDKFMLSDIKYFKMGKSDINHSSYLKIILKKGIIKQYSFFNQLNDSENVLKNVYQFFKQYNRDTSLNDKIQILPNFYLTKQGKLSIALLGVLIFIGIAIQI